MVGSTIEMAKTLGASVVAEGFEDKEIRDIRTTLGCDLIQGWSVGKPVLSSQFIQEWCNSDPTDAQPAKRRAV
jgi:EAL domain-containing protein (putative c-di-GMP-specific phosphodiesterase class I)